MGIYIKKGKLPPAAGNVLFLVRQMQRQTLIDTLQLHLVFTCGTAREIVFSREMTFTSFHPDFIPPFRSASGRLHFWV
jgi:hypothetical protein